MDQHTLRRTSRLHRARSHQGGAVLLIALIALSAMIAAGFSLFRTVDTTNVAATNFQFMRSAEQNVDLAFNEALLAYMRTHPDAALNIVDRNVSTPMVAYQATAADMLAAQTLGPGGIPMALLNAAAPTFDANGPVPASAWPGQQIDPTTRQLRRYLIERMCQPAAEGTDADPSLCGVYVASHPNVSNPDGASFDEVLPNVRITVRVDGPKGSVAYGQMFLKGE
jgi:hypothetical protein